MRYFLTLYRLRLKAALLSSAVLVSAVFLALTLAFALLLPERAPAALAIGVLTRGAIAGDALEILMENGEYTVKAYTEPEKLRDDVLSGQLHCGYDMNDEWSEEKPVTVYYTDEAYLRPLLDQLVLSAYFEAKMPRMTQEYLDGRGYGAQDAAALLEEQRRSSRTLEVELRAVGKEAPLPASAAQNLQPLLYAVLTSLFLAVAVIDAMLVSGPAERAQEQLRRLSGHRLASAAAPVLARLTLYLAVLLAADGLLSVIWDGLYYPAAARLTLLALLALAGTVPGLAAGVLRRRAALIAALLPPWMLVSVFCSGALVDPELFPMGLGFLRFLSPAWYALGWMNAF